MQSDVEDLRWYFSNATGDAFGLHSSSVDRSGSGAVDQATIERMHARMLSASHRRDVQRFERVHRSIARLSFHDAQSVALVLSPIGAGRCNLWALESTSLGALCLINLIVELPSFVAAYEKSCTPLTRHRWIERYDASAKRAVQIAKLEAKALFDAALARYSSARADVRREEQRDNDERRRNRLRAAGAT